MLLCVGIRVATELSVNGRDLVTGQAFASTKRHVLLCVRHARETRRRFGCAYQVVVFDRYDGRERIFNDNDAETVVERCPRDVGASGALCQDLTRGTYYRQKAIECSYWRQRAAGTERLPCSARFQFRFA